MCFTFCIWNVDKPYFFPPGMVGLNRVSFLSGIKLGLLQENVKNLINSRISYVICFHVFQAGILAVGRGNKVVEPVIGDDGTKFLPHIFNHESLMFQITLQVSLVILLSRN